jgi:hypothetical protein
MATSENCKGKRFDGYVAGDFHTHTNLSDGSNSESLVTQKAFKDFGLDWFANTDHGGAFNRNPYGATWDTLSSKPYIKGLMNMSSGHQNMWRWQSLLEYSFPIVTELRDQYPTKKIIQGFEWNCPSHEHANIGIISNEGKSVSDFEYLFDQNDNDTSRNVEFGITVKQNKTHADALTGLAWLKANYPTTAYLHFNHPSRKLKYSVADFRDFYNLAPEMIVGIEGMPGHQKEASRCGYSNSNVIAHSYGGADYMFAKMGGLWDALLSEGRKVWITSNSDFHDTTGDFWPGEFQKNYTFVVDSNDDKHLNMNELLDGMKSGNSFVVTGDLIQGIQVNVTNDINNRRHRNDYYKNKQKSATLGQTLNLSESNEIEIEIIVTVNDGLNNNGDRVIPDHIDIIMGSVHTPALPGSAEYSIDTVSTTKIVKTLTSDKFIHLKDFDYIAKCKLTVSENSYIRIRGTNVPVNTPYETDTMGNPLDDSLMGTNNPETAYSDLWFYTNPVFINYTASSSK